YSAARSPRSDSMILLTMHLQQYARLQRHRQGLLGQPQEHLAGEPQRLLLVQRDVRLLALGEPMQEHVAGANPSRQQRAVSTALAATRARHSLLVEEAAQVRVDQTAFHLPDRLA